MQGQPANERSAPDQTRSRLEEPLATCDTPLTGLHRISSTAVITARAPEAGRSVSASATSPPAPSARASLLPPQPPPCPKLMLMLAATVAALALVLAPVLPPPPPPPPRRPLPRLPPTLLRATTSMPTHCTQRGSSGRFAVVLRRLLAAILGKRASKYLATRRRALRAPRGSVLALVSSMLTTPAAISAT